MDSVIFIYLAQNFLNFKKSVQTFDTLDSGCTPLHRIGEHLI